MGVWERGRLILLGFKGRHDAPHYGVEMDAAGAPLTDSLGELAAAEDAKVIEIALGRADPMPGR